MPPPRSPDCPDNVNNPFIVAVPEIERAEGVNVTASSEVNEIKVWPVVVQVLVSSGTSMINISSVAIAPLDQLFASVHDPPV